MLRIKKKLVAAAILGSSMLIPMASYAAPAETTSLSEGEPSYTWKNVTYHFFDKDKVDTMNVVFRDDLESVPYIDAADYLSMIKTVPFTEEKKDGEIVVSGKAGSFTVDAEKDTMTFENYYLLTSDTYDYVKPGSALDVNYAREKKQEVIKDTGAVTIDFSKYNIDIMEIDDKVYFPLPTISDLFASGYNAAEYMDGDIYFVGTMEAQYSGSTQESYVDRTTLYNTEERDASLAEYTYNELCFVFDVIYGKPSQSMLAESIRKDGFDTTLKDYNDDTRRARELLHSTDPAEFTRGLVLLQPYLHDGGHTSTMQELLTELVNVYPTSVLGNAYMNGDLAKMAETDSDLRNAIMPLVSKQMQGSMLKQFRAKAFEAYGYEPVLGGEGEWDATTMLLRSGDTVLFVFDSFDSKVVPWFKQALDYAAENDVKNFIVDLSCNGGGNTGVLVYMLGIMGNKDGNSNTTDIAVRYEVSGEEVRTVYEVDMDLDGEYTDADKKVAYDLNYGIVSSSYSFSCGNLMPVLAKERGIMILGETSGGGACSIMKNYTPDGHFYLFSSERYFITQSGNDVDLGVKVDKELTKLDDEGYANYSDYYLIEGLERYMNEFYADPADVKKAAGVMARIDALKDVEEITVSDKNAVALARTAYELLTPEQKELVYEETLAKLEAAEEKLEVLYGQATLEAAKAYAIDRLDDYSGARAKLDATKAEKAAYSKVVDKGKAAIRAAKDKDKVAEALAKAKAAVDAAIVKIDKDRANAAAAKAVTNAIAKLPAKAKVKTKDKAAINAAYNAYKNLTKAQKTYISTASKNKLKNARAGLTIAVNKEAAQKVTGMIKKLPAAKKVKKANKKAIQSARAAYNKLTKAQKKYVTKAVLKKLTAAEKALKKLK